MQTQYKGVPAGASAVIPRLFCHDVEAQIEFCFETLGAVESGRRPGRAGPTRDAAVRPFDAHDRR